MVQVLPTAALANTLTTPLLAFTLHTAGVKLEYTAGMLGSGTGVTVTLTVPLPPKTSAGAEAKLRVCVQAVLQGVAAVAASQAAST
jgi:hypothetical protein